MSLLTGNDSSRGQLLNVPYDRNCLPDFFPTELKSRDYTPSYFALAVIVHQGADWKFMNRNQH
jgi:hypothetical protein